MAGRLILMMISINAAKKCPQNILSWDNAQQLAIIFSDLKWKHHGLTRWMSGIITITTAPSTLAGVLNHCPKRSCSSTISSNSYNCQGSQRHSTMLGEWEYQVYPHRGFTHCTDHQDLHLSCPPTDQAVAVPWCQFLLPYVITTSHGSFWFRACTHDTLNSAMEVVPIILLSSKIWFIRSKENNFQLWQLFCFAF